MRQNNPKILYWSHRYFTNEEACNCFNNSEKSLRQMQGRNFLKSKPGDIVYVLYGYKADSESSIQLRMLYKCEIIEIDNPKLPDEMNWDGVLILRLINKFEEISEEKLYENGLPKYERGGYQGYIGQYIEDSLITYLDKHIDNDK